MADAFTLTQKENGIAELKFDLPGEKVNKLSIPVLHELEGHIDQLAKNPNVQALLITSGKEGVFIAGADLKSFEPAFKTPGKAEEIIRTGHQTFEKLASLPFPTIAVIDGACLGGGLELALSCSYRLVSDSPKTQLGLPEVSLGIFPGWGGTQRLPRLIGLQEGLGIILGGKSVNGLKAWKLKIADEIVRYEFLKEGVESFLKVILTQEGKKKVQKRRGEKSFFTSLLEDNGLGQSVIFHLAKKNVLEKTGGNYPAPLIALDVVKSTYSLNLNEGLKKEADIFVENIGNGFGLAKDLIGMFFTQEALKKQTGAPSGTKSKEVKSAAVIGAGTMGGTIAWLLADKGIFVRLKDLTFDIIGKGLSHAKSLFQKGVKVKKLTKSEAELKFQLISGTVDDSGFQHADFVIEAATENLELKRKIFTDLEKVVKKDTIIASNTSSLTIDSMAEGMKYPDRFVGMHFFNPVNKMPLVEVVAGTKTSKEAIATTVELAKKLGKTPIVVKDCPGFLVNRIFLVGANEMMLMLEEGYTMEEINEAALQFGMPMAPFELVDEVGVDVTYKVCEVFYKAYGERMNPSQILKSMVDSGNIGKKANKGFYLYDGKKKTENPNVKTLLKNVHRRKNTLKKEEILPRFLFSMINEASRCLEEKVVERADFLDMALIMGTGFPPYRGGLLRYADTIGAKKIVTDLKNFQESQGIRFTPSKLLEQMSQNNTPFYSDEDQT